MRHDGVPRGKENYVQIEWLGMMGELCARDGEVQTTGAGAGLKKTALGGVWAQSGDAGL